MKNNKKTYIYIAVIIILIIILAVVVKFALSNDNENNNKTESSVGTTESGMQEIVKESTTLKQKSNRGEISYTEYTAEINLSTLTVTGEDIEISGSTIKITSEGTYYFTGTLSDGNIVVNASDSSNVVLVFDNANITSKTTAVINGVNAKNIIISLKEGSTNTFTDSSEYTEFTSDDEPDATIFSKTDLIICGTGTLNVNANYGDSIVSKDDLVITNATLKINTADDGIRGKDCVDIKDANITINAKGDGIKSTNDSDTEKGYVIIDGGKISIESASDAIHSEYYIIINGGDVTLSSGDDGMHADTNIIINNGNINVTKSYEGLESGYIEINDGNINITASDDGINATDGTSSEFGPGGMMNNESSNSNVEIVINGGKVYVNSQGDGLDANGSITITGGETTVAGTTNGGNAALDYDSTFNISGGSIVVYGATGMWQNPSTSSTQYSICFSKSGNANDTVELKDSKGNTIESFTTEKSYGAILISNSKLTKGETYTLYVNGESVSYQELTSIVTSNVSSQGQGMFGGNQRGNRQR